jgi:hypothetical protein
MGLNMVKSSSSILSQMQCKSLFLSRHSQWQNEIQETTKVLGQVSLQGPPSARGNTSEALTSICIGVILFKFSLRFSFLDYHAVLKFDSEMLNPMSI